MPEERLQVQWEGYSALESVERRVGDGADYRVQCLLENRSGDGIRGEEEKFNFALTSFRLLDFCLSLDCELPIKQF